MYYFLSSKKLIKLSSILFFRNYYIIFMLYCAKWHAHRGIDAAVTRVLVNSSIKMPVSDCSKFTDRLFHYSELKTNIKVVINMTNRV